MASKDDAMRWTAISIPSNAQRADEHSKADHGKKAAKGRKQQPGKPIHRAPAQSEPPPSARAALERIDMPPDAVERISELLTPGSSIIVSDNKLSGETGEYTDFIVLTP
jgi:hypothetical protein